MLRVRVAIPAMDELEFLPVTLDALANQQTKYPFDVYVCVNQPDEYWNRPERVSVCEHNRQLLDYLSHYDFLTLHILDYSSPGNGWKGRKTGVGYARKALFERILSESEKNDLVVSMDADTWVRSGYLQSLADQFESDSGVSAVAVPYYHEVNLNDEVQSRAVLRYEIYMRNYAVNLLRIGSPYGFTALGSAIAMRAGALRKVGNITPFQSGEDFYLVQKFCKMGGLRLFNTECVYPSGRFSDRVPFGTGPAVTQGVQNKWGSYPIYSQVVFRPIATAYRLLRDLYAQKADVKGNDFLYFLQEKNKGEDIWKSIRENVSDFDHFEKAFHQKADGLRILQYVRARQKDHIGDESLSLFENMREWMPENDLRWILEHPSLMSFSVKQLNRIRDLLFQYEQILRESYPDSAYS